jgi:hypothetical protein
MFKYDTRFFSVWNSYLSSWGFIFSTLLICFLIISILINIQLTFAYNYKNTIHIKKYYLIASFSLTTILSVLPVTFNKFNFDHERNYFWYNSAIWEWSTYTGWITITILYCLFSPIYTLYRLNKNPSQLRLNSFTSDTSTTLTSTLSETQSQSKLISKYISRIILYSLIPILAYLPSLISTLAHYYSNSYSYTLNLFSLVFISSQSIFTFIIFLFDPVIDEVVLEHKRNAEHKKHVLDNIKKGIYVENIYNIDRELPSNREQNAQQENNKINKDGIHYRNTIYSYARNAKNRISILTTTVLYNKKKSIDVKRDVFNLDSEENEILTLL